MAYVIAEPCIGTKDTACVDACPVDCIHPKKDETGHGDAEQLRSEEHTVRREGERIPGECQDGLIQFRTKELSFLGMQFEAAPGMDESVQRTALGIPNQPYEPVCNLK